MFNKMNGGKKGEKKKMLCLCYPVNFVAFVADPAVEFVASSPVTALALVEASVALSPVVASVALVVAGPLVVSLAVAVANSYSHCYY